MLRNKEIRRFAGLLLALTAVFSAAGFCVHPAAGALCLCASAAFCAAFFAFTRARYQRLAALSQQIDRVLHNADALLADGESEGELSILESEIIKMTRRIREQNHALQQEKQNLADSLADIAHQLRTPLTSIALLLSLLQKNPEESQRRRLLREADGLLRRMDWLLTALLTLSRLDAGVAALESKPIVVRRLMDAALEPLRIPMELRGIALTVTVPPEATLQGDERWLAEALQNVLKNAMESAGENGHIEIACEDNPLYTQLTVRDSGPGFDEETLAHLFDRFYRGKNQGGAGYGIGLALCRSILLRQGGTVTAKNHPRGGAVFFLRFPKPM